MFLSSRNRFPTPFVCLIAAAVVFGSSGCQKMLEDLATEAGGTATQSETESPKGEFIDGQNGAAAQPAAADTVEPAAVGQSPPAAGPAGVPGRPLPAQTNVLPIRLSAGVALAQTLPGGTGMSFSVDYRFQSGQPNQSNKYVWVIQRGDGQTMGQPVQLAARGNLPLIVPRLRPETGPFSSHILEVSPDGSKRKISNSISLR